MCSPVNAPVLPGEEDLEPSGGQYLWDNVPVNAPVLPGSLKEENLWVNGQLH